MMLFIIIIIRFTVEGNSYDAKRQGPGPHVHFWAVSHVTGISGIFRFVLPFLPLWAQFSSELPEILHEVS